MKNILTSAHILLVCFLPVTHCIIQCFWVAPVKITVDLTFKNTNIFKTLLFLSFIGVRSAPQINKKKVLVDILRN